MTDADAIDVVAEPERALALLQPQRRQILERLDEPCSAAALGRLLDLPRQQVNYHLRELERHGFVEVADTRQRGSVVERVWRRTGRAYAISSAALGALGATPRGVADRFSSAHLIALAARAVRELGELRGAARAAGKPLSTLALDAEIRFASPADRKAFGEELVGMLARLIEKYHAPDARRGRDHRVWLGAHPRPPDPAS